jgi:hypothetical protein
MRELGRKVFIWTVFLTVSAWVVIIILSQNSFGFGPFVVDPDVPHEGRYVFAGLAQLLFFFWMMFFVLKVLHRSNISLLYVVSFPASRDREHFDIRSTQLGLLSAWVSSLFLIGKLLKF